MLSNLKLLRSTSCYRAGLRKRSRILITRYYGTKRNIPESLSSPSFSVVPLVRKKRVWLPIAKLKESEARAEIMALNDEIEMHDMAYYELNSPTISDSSYDKLIRRAQDLEGKFQSLKGIVQHFQRVGLSPRSGVSKFGAFEHTKPLLSLDNAFNFEELNRFTSKCSAKLSSSDEPIEYIIEPKIDGLSLALHYREGVLVGAGTRGDGIIGENVTENARHVSGIPYRITAPGLPIFFEIRGEVYLSSDDFASLNSKRLAANQSLFATPRNAAAGSLRQIDSSVVKERHLSFFAYELIMDRSNAAVHCLPPSESPIVVKTQTQTLSYLADLGFDVAAPWRKISLPSGDMDMKSHLESMGGHLRNSLGYETDGAVVKLNRFDHRDVLGQVSRYPNWAIAYKFPAAEATTMLEDILVQVGRTGVLTPVAVLQKVLVGGVFVERATLHNEMEVRRLRLNPGMMVRVKRSGDVIPKITGLVQTSQLNESSLFEYTLPSACPVCGSPTEREEGGILVRCSGGALVCSAQAIELIRHFCSKAAVDIEGIGLAKAEYLFTVGLVKTPADIFKLRMQDLDGENQSGDTLRGRKGWGDRSVNNLLSAIDKRRKIPMQKFLYALGIRHVGLETAKDISRKFRTFHDLWNYLVSESVKDAFLPDTGALLEAINGVGPKAVLSLLDLARDVRSRSIVEELMREVSIEDFSGESEVLKQFDSTTLKGQTIVFTGKFTRCSRKFVENVCVERGAYVGSGITKATTLLVEGGDNPCNHSDETLKLSIKAQKARTLGVMILSEIEFIVMFDIGL